jgi:excisionase family DNA binding protein
VSEAVGGEAGGRDACRERCPVSSPNGVSNLSEVRFLTVAEVAAVMRVSKMTVYRLVHAGDLAAVRVGRSFRVPERAVHDYLQGAFTEAG